MALRKSQSFGLRLFCGAVAVFSCCRQCPLVAINDKGGIFLTYRSFRKASVQTSKRSTTSSPENMFRIHNEQDIWINPSRYFINSTFWCSTPWYPFPFKRRFLACFPPQALDSETLLHWFHSFCMRLVHEFLRRAETRQGQGSRLHKRTRTPAHLQRESERDIEVNTWHNGSLSFPIRPCLRENSREQRHFLLTLQSPRRRTTITIALGFFFSI